MAATKVFNAAAAAAVGPSANHHHFAVQSLMNFPPPPQLSSDKNNHNKQRISSCVVERVNDVFFEPVYEYSSAHDHNKRIGRAFNSAPITHLISSGQHHFSAIPSHYPAHCGVARNTSYIPRDVHLGYPGQIHVSSITEPWDVTGRNRYKYLHKPLVPYIPGGQELILARLIDDIRQFNSREVLLGDFSTSHRTQGCQTDYRENEAQTEPYTPPTRVISTGAANGARSGDAAADARTYENVPEVLRLAHMTIANRWLPVDINAVEFVERMRRRAEWEKTLPDITDLEQLPKRLRLMEAMERDEWRYREQRFAKLQKIQRRACEAMKQRVRDFEESVNSKRMAMVWQEKIQALSRVKSDVARSLARDMRKILDGYKQRKMKWTLNKKDIVRDYINFGSHIYAPLMRHGLIRRDHVPKRFGGIGCAGAGGDGSGDASYEKILKFERNLHKQVLDKMISVPLPPSKVNKKGFVRREYRHDRALERVRVDNEQQRTQNAEALKNKREPLRLKQRVEHIAPRPTTPRKCREYSRQEELFELAVIFLQKLIRGRVVQNQMHEGLEKRRELIVEIRTTHALQTSEKLEKEQQRVRVLNEQLSEQYLHMQEQYIDHGIQQLEGESLSIFMEFLNKELLRVREERRLHAFVWLALRQQRLREAREAGRRQVELRRRHEEEEIFRQMSQVHNDTLDDYLSQIVASSEQKVSHELATAEIEQKAKQVAEASKRAKRKAAENQDENDARGLITRMMYEYMLPQTNRRLQQLDADTKLKARLEAAHMSMVEAVKSLDVETEEINLSAAAAVASATAAAELKAHDDYQPQNAHSAAKNPE